MSKRVRRAVLVAFPPGTGKNYVFTDVIPRAHPNARILYLAPTIALLAEMTARFQHPRGWTPAVLRGIDSFACPEKRSIQNLMKRRLPYAKHVCARCPLLEACGFHRARREAQAAPVVFATIQLAVAHPKFFERYAREIVVFDEASYDQLLDPFTITEAELTRFQRIVDALPEAPRTKAQLISNRMRAALGRAEDVDTTSLWDGFRWRAADDEAVDEVLAGKRAYLNASNLLPLLRNLKKHGETLRYRGGRLIGWRRVDLPVGPTYFVLDATGDARIVGASLGAEVQVLKPSATIIRTAKVIQIVSSSCSKHALGRLQPRTELRSLVERFLAECARHGRRPALAMRPSMAGQKGTDHDDYELLVDLPQKFCFVNEETAPATIEPNTIPVITFGGRERGVNVLTSMGVTDILVIGTLRPQPQDLVDRARVLLGLTTSNTELLAMSRATEITVRTRLGFEATWEKSGFLNPEVHQLFRHMVVAPVVQAAERIRTILEHSDQRIEKRVFLALQEDVSDWLRPDFVGSYEAVSAQWLS